MDTSSTNVSNAPATPFATRRSAIVKWAFIIGIAVLSNLFAYYVVQVLYPEPQYQTFCPAELNSKAIQSAEECQATGGMWQANYPASKEASGYCDVTYTCQKQYEAADKVYSRNMFVVFVIVGAAMLIASAFLATVEAITSGLAFGGVLAFLIGSIRYWENMQEWLRVIVLGLALAGLIYFAWKKFKD